MLVFFETCLKGDELKVGIVGIGNMGSKYINKFNELGLNYVLVDSDSSKFEKFPQHIPKYTTLQEAIEREEISHLFVATSPQSHIPIAKVAISNGINVMVEKPPALDTKTLEEAIDLALCKGVYFSVSEIELLSNSIRNLQKDKNWERVEGYRLNLGKGYINPFYDLAWHDLYIFHHMFGKFEIKHLKNEGNLISIYVKGENIDFFLQVAWLNPFLKRQWHLYSKDGETVLNFVEDKIYYPDGSVKEKDNVDKLRLMIENFLNRPSYESSYRALDILKEVEKIKI